MRARSPCTFALLCGCTLLHSLYSRRSSRRSYPALCAQYERALCGVGLQLLSNALRSDAHSTAQQLMMLVSHCALPGKPKDHGRTIAAVKSLQLTSANVVWKELSISRYCMLSPQPASSSSSSSPSPAPHPLPSLTAISNVSGLLHAESETFAGNVATVLSRNLPLQLRSLIRHAVRLSVGVSSPLQLSPRGCDAIADALLLTFCGCVFQRRRSTDDKDDEADHNVAADSGGGDEDEEDDDSNTNAADSVDDVEWINDDGLDDDEDVEEQLVRPTASHAGDRKIGRLRSFEQLVGARSLLVAPATPSDQVPAALLPSLRSRVLPHADSVLRSVSSRILTSCEADTVLTHAISAVVELTRTHLPLSCLAALLFAGTKNSFSCMLGMCVPLACGFSVVRCFVRLW